MLVTIYFAGWSATQALLRALSGQEYTLAVVVSTLVIAALFNPFEAPHPPFIDRRFYRRKYDAAKTLEVFPTCALPVCTVPSLLGIPTVISSRLRKRRE